jgi:hypothetical protein
MVIKEFCDQANLDILQSSTVIKVGSALSSWNANFNDHLWTNSVVNPDSLWTTLQRLAGFHPTSGYLLKCCPTASCLPLGGYDKPLLVKQTWSYTNLEAFTGKRNQPFTVEDFLFLSVPSSLPSSTQLYKWSPWHPSTSPQREFTVPKVGEKCI